MNVSTLVEFDRESNGDAGKVLMLPIVISDSGKPKQTATRYLPVIIGDKNDNPMYDGTKRIHIFNYKGIISSVFWGFSTLFQGFKYIVY